MSTATDNTNLLAQFCGFDRKYDTRTPFNVSGYRYATDTRIMLRIPTDEQTDEYRDLPPIGMLPWPKTAPTDLLPWPAAPYDFRWEEVGRDVDDDPIEAFVTAPMFVRMAGGELILSKYHYLISTLPNARFHPDTFKGATGYGFYFAFDGGEGLLMCADPPDYVRESMGVAPVAAEPQEASADLAAGRET